MEVPIYVYVLTEYSCSIFLYHIALHATYVPLNNLFSIRTCRKKYCDFC